MPALIQYVKSKTLVFSLLLTILSLLQGNLQLFELDATGQMYVGLGVSVIVAVLRFLTTAAVSEK